MNATPSRAFHSSDSLPRPENGMGAIAKSHPKVVQQSSAISGPSVREMAGAAAHRRAMELARDVSRRSALAAADADGVLPLVAAGFGEWFRPALQRWLQLNFDNIEHVSRAFGVRHSTAANWWNARNCPGGEPVGVVFLSFPAAVAWFLAEWRGH